MTAAIIEALQNVGLIGLSITVLAIVWASRRDRKLLLRLWAERVTYDDACRIARLEADRAVGARTRIAERTDR